MRLLIMAVLYRYETNGSKRTYHTTGWQVAKAEDQRSQASADRLKTQSNYSIDNIIYYDTIGVFVE